MGDGPTAWERIVQIGNVLVCMGLLVEIIFLNIVTDKYLADFESRAQIAKRTIHFGWLIFLGACHLSIPYVKDFDSWKTLPGKMIVSGVIYFLICPSMLSDPVLVRIGNNSIDTSVVSSIFRPKFDNHSIFISYIVVSVTALVFGIAQIVLGYHNVGGS